MRFGFLFAAALLTSAARASNSVSNEFGVSRTQASDTNPRAGSLSDNLIASFDLGEQWTLNGGFSIFAESQTPAAKRGAFGSSGNAVTSVSLGVDCDVTENLTAGVSFELSPKSTQFAGTQLFLTGPGGATTAANALLRSQSSQWAGAVDVSYDMAGDSDLEWSFGGGVTASHFSTDQNIALVRTAAGVTGTPQQIRDYCAANPTKCSRALLAALRPQTGAQLDSQRFTLSTTATLYRDTDLTLSGDYYHYDQDPTAVGYFSIASAGRTAASGGNGVPIAPIRFMVRPEVLHRFGDFSARVWLQLGEYVSGAGQGTSGGGLKLQYKFSKAFRMWVTLSGQRDVDEQGNATNAGTGALGAGYRF